MNETIKSKRESFPISLLPINLIVRRIKRYMNTVRMNIPHRTCTPDASFLHRNSFTSFDQNPSFYEKREQDYFKAPAHNMYHEKEVH